MCPTSKQGCRSYWLLWVPSALWRESSAPWLCSVYALSFCSPPATWFIIILFYPIPFRDYSVVLHKQKYPKKQLCFAPVAVLSPVVGAIALQTQTISVVPRSTGAVSKALANSSRLIHKTRTEFTNKFLHGFIVCKTEDHQWPVSLKHQGTYFN